MDCSAEKRVPLVSVFKIYIIKWHDIMSCLLERKFNGDISTNIQFSITTTVQNNSHMMDYLKSSK